MTPSRMHELLDQIQQWVHDVRAEIPPRTGYDEEPTPTHTAPLQNLATVIAKLNTTADLPDGMRRPAEAPSTEALQYQLAQERLDAWLDDTKHLDPADLDDWTGHRKLLKGFVLGGYEAEAAGAFEQFLIQAGAVGIAYNRTNSTFYFIPLPESQEEALRHPY